MIDPKLIREELSHVKQSFQNRCYDMKTLDTYVQLDRQWRDEKIQLDLLRQQQHELTPKGKPSSDQLKTLKRLADTIKQKHMTFYDLEKKLRYAAMMVPNIPDSSVVLGKDEHSNVVNRTVGQIRPFDFPVQSHNELGESLGILDFEKAAAISGSRFVVYKGVGARLERSLINFMLDVHTTEHGYTEILPPVLVATHSMQGTGQLPKFSEDSFQISDSDFWLSPTAEVQLTNLYRHSIIDETDLPIKLVAATPCFRKEAGSYGKDVKGLIRHHQFNKVELVNFVQPEKSFECLDHLTKAAEVILQKLELPYRVVNLCTGDLGFSSAKTYDLEVWFPSQNKYREISSCSNFLDFQCRRAMIRYRKKVDSSVTYLHTLNGSGLAIGRTVAAILENYQCQDGRIIVPDVLQKYMEKRKI